jgi:superfamily II DNA or RNA helicase
VQKLFDLVHEECSPGIWSRAQTQARSGQLTGKRGQDGSLELRMATKGGMIAPLVTLHAEEGEWTCECPSNEPVCPHVAAAVIALQLAEKEGRDLLGVRAPAGRVAYDLVDRDGQLMLERWVVNEGTRSKLTGRLIEERQRGEHARITSSRADVEIELLLGSLRDGPVPRPLMPKLLDWLSDCDDVTLEGERIEIGAPVHGVAARVDRHGDGFRLSAGVNPALTRVYRNGAALCGGKLCAVRDVEVSEGDLASLRKGRIFEHQDLADLVGRVLPALRERLPIHAPKELAQGATKQRARIVLQADVMRGVLEVLPTIVYGDPPCARVDNGKLTYLGGPVALRDIEAENSLSSLLQQKLGLEVGRRKRLEGEAALKLTERVRTLDAVSVSGSGLESFTLRGALAPRLDVSGERIDFGFRTEAGEHASAENVLAAYQHGSPLVALDGGGFAPLPNDFLAQYGHLVLSLVQSKREGELPKAALVDVARLCEALDEPPPPNVASLRALANDFSGIPDAPLPDDLRAELRTYQRDGYRWLKFLSDHELAALLADDMGLGKTVQALAVLRFPALVVCPASVVFNWAEEIARFRPGLKVSTYHGANRTLDDKADITITTYGTLRVDVGELSVHPWDTVVLDEAQTIKNPDSQVARAAYQLRARFRMALTGTPVENRLTDLWSLFHFLHRGYLGGLRDFEEQYARPIAEGNAEVANKLRARIKPFVLRRLKREVAKELPPRTDVVLRCTLEPDERALYESVRAATQKEVLEQLAAGGNVLAVLEALLRLRQACCHRSLLPGQTSPSSSKLELMLDTLEEALDEGHKALVFSQWTSLLDLVEPHLRTRGIRFARLDGSTVDRGGAVRQFQDDPSTSVMLLSLKAGGTGLNLTAADHVFLMDPWWNPAAEDQAADRAHRIGQDRPVLVHRLIAADTVEERILALQERKRALASVATDGGTQALGITRDDLLALFD